MKKYADRLIGKIIVLACIISAVYLVYSIAATQFLPVQYLLAISALLVILVACMSLLIWKTKSKFCYVFATVLAVLFLVIDIVGGVYLSKTTSTVKSITTTSTQTAVVGIFVRSDDPNDFNEVAADYTYGVLAELDRQNTDAAVEQFYAEFGLQMHTVDYAGLPGLIDALLEGETDAIILNVAYLDLLEEMDGYRDIAERIRQVTFQSVEKPKNGFDMTSTGNEPEEPEESHSDVFTMYISGSDSRVGLADQSRSDVNILAVVNAETRQVLLISTPRDFYVPLSISDGKKDKLTHAGIYGIDVCMDTIGMLYDVDVDYYFRVNFTGFVDIIDALGGITVDSEQEFQVGKYTFTAGANELDGDAALVFARERYTFADGDRQRGRNQMAVIKGVINKMLSKDMLVHYVSVLMALEDSFETSVPFAMVSRLVRTQLRDGGRWNIVSYSVNGTDASQIPYSMSQYAYVMIPDETTVSTAKDLVQAVLAGETIKQP